MSSQKTKFSVGLFVSSGIVIALLAVIWLGMSRFFEKGRYYAAYFNESVQGLDIDSPVKYRGVTIGRVESIGVAPDSRLIQVIMKIESGQSLDSDIVAQLKSVGITGSMFVELDRKRKGEPDRSPPLSFPSEYPIIASKPSDISELFRGLDDVLGQIKALDLEGISDKAKSVLDNVDDTLDDLNLKAISAEVRASLEGLRHILEDRRWDRIIASVERAGVSLNAAMDKAVDVVAQGEGTLGRIDQIVDDEKHTITTAFENFRQAMEKANLLLEKGTSLVGGTDETLLYLQNNLIVTAQNLEKASENLNRLMELLADHPPQLLFGQPPAPRKGVGPELPEKEP
jgi:phospholipid/cholesterol/gamma-HCH transport system substrate-binding protein